jgi:hypothetical protein
MPLTLTGRSINTGNLSPMIPIVSDNPAFKVAIVPVDGRMEQKPNAKSDAAQQAAIKIGDYISGETVRDSRTAGEKVAGRVLQVLINGQEVYAYKILDAENKEVLVDPTTATREDRNGQDEDLIENAHALSFAGWLAESKKLDEMSIPPNKWIDVEMNKLDKEEVDHIWKMYTETYAKEGLDFSADDENELRTKYKATFLKDVDNDNQSDVFIIHKETRYGNKIALLGTNDKKEAKKELIKKVIDLLNTRGWFIEASLKMEQILSTSRVPVIDDQAMISDIVGKEKKVEFGENGYYTRFLSKANKRITKRMYGIPK